MTHDNTGVHIATIGDNVVDIFAERMRAYPGGNALNVASYAVLLHGKRASYCGITGTDRFAQHVMSTIQEIGVVAPNVRRVEGPCGQALVDVAPDGDRIFVGSNRGGVQASLTLRLTPNDIEALKAAPIIHTSVYSNLDDQLGRLSAITPVSYDFSEAPASLDAITHLLPSISVAFFSGSRLAAHERRDLARRVIAAGTEAVVITAGAEGALGMTRTAEAFAPIIPTTVIDTMGAGDAFITGFLLDWTVTNKLESAMAAGAASGARACALEGAFGHPLSVTADEIASLRVASANA